ncbi:hypothetical protein [Parvularcula sp. LCG005]|uniref:hypothetical protein n=1 Tax=Parvularcula sp. LCG005 TaxID=3078805 RepID=UPI002941CEF0|nr:hypothetical protein [Parvularcula sp. LCG005]WOI54362.1 hypothetical protein RUI03_05010 [Parvularcula sp. LCG005]
MKDRLQQIWSGFGERTTLDLSGTSINNTPRPGFERNLEREAHALDRPMAEALRATHLPDGMTDPVGAAFSALHSSMAAQKKPARGRKARAQDMPTASFAMPESNIEKTLLADLAFTRSKTVRRDSDYISYAAARQADWQKRKRKRFLGIF